jgi:hypothetical protein
MSDWPSARGGAAHRIVSALLANVHRRKLMADEPKAPAPSRRRRVPNAGIAAGVIPEESGFMEDSEPAGDPEVPATAVSPTNGHAQEPEAASVVDPLQQIIGSEAFPEALRIIADRLLKAEVAFNQMLQRHPDEFSTGEALAQFRGELHQHSQTVQRIGQVVHQLSQQRAMQELFAERNARGTALDLAIKALPESARTPEAIVAHAEAFLGWLKSGTQA